MKVVVLIVNNADIRNVGKGEIMDTEKLNQFIKSITNVQEMLASNEYKQTIGIMFDNYSSKQQVQVHMKEAQIEQISKLLNKTIEKEPNNADTYIRYSVKKDNIEFFALIEKTEEIKKFNEWLKTTA